MNESERVMDGCRDVKWCNMDSDGQMERKRTADRWCMDGEEVITEGGERGSEPESCQSSVRRAQD